MADVVSKSVTWSAGRKRITPIDTMADFQTFVSDFI